MGRVVLQHEDGRRVGAEEAEVDQPERNPFNHGQNVVRFNGDTGASETVTLPARPLEDHVSLPDEGFVIVADINADGQEVARDDKLYRGEGLAKVSRPSDIGRRLTNKEGNP